jgi:hypothetical protein
VRGHIDHGVVRQGSGVRAHDGAMCMNIEAVFLKHEVGVGKHRLDVHAPGHQCESHGGSGCTNRDAVCPCTQVLFVKRRGVFGKRLAVFEQHGGWVGLTAEAVALADRLCFRNLRSMCRHIVVELAKWQGLFDECLRSFWKRIGVQMQGGGLFGAG